MFKMIRFSSTSRLKVIDPASATGALDPSSCLDGLY